MNFIEQYANTAVFSGIGIILAVLGFVVAVVSTLSSLDGRAYKIVRGAGFAILAAGIIVVLSASVQQSNLINTHVNEAVHAQHGGEVRNIHSIKHSDGNTYTATYVRNGVETPSIVHLDGNNVTITSTTGESF